jgi:hypothetical protein
METSSDQEKLTGADRPFFTTRECLDEFQSLSSVSFARGDLSIGRYRRDRPGLGISTPNPIVAMVMAVVIFRPRAAHAGWHDGRVVEVPALGTGALSCLDLREAWSMDLSEPFDSFHTFIPLTAFDEVTSDLTRPRIERLHCPIGVEHMTRCLAWRAHLIQFWRGPSRPLHSLPTTFFSDGRASRGNVWKS